MTTSDGVGKKINTEYFLQLATRRAALHDYGDTAFIEGLDRLTEEINGNADLTPAGKIFIQSRITDLLVNRLQIVERLKHDPLARNTAIVRPVFIIGTGRAGSTFISHVLSRVSAFRSLSRRQARETVSSQGRSPQHIFHTRAFGTANNPTRHIHHEAPDDPTSCTAVFAHDFKSFEFEHYALLPRYAEWFDHCDKHSAYAHHLNTLKVAGSDNPGRWFLKTAQHSLALPALLDTYPDAGFIHVHRDPFTSLSSRASFVKTLQSRFCREPDEARIRERWSGIMRRMMLDLEAFRRHTDRPVIDIRYQDLLERPFDVVQSIYAFFNETMDAQAEQRIRRYIEENPQGKFGKHVYESADDALGADVKEVFHDYKKQYAL